MSNCIGVLIRRERLRQNVSQEGLCRGICAASYLSKIEQGKTAAGEDILRPLLSRLGIRYETDGAFLAEAGETVECLYELLLSGQEDLPSFEDRLAWLEGRRERCLSSPFLLDVLLLLACARRGPTEQELEDFVPCMDRRQYALYLALRLYGGLESAGEELLRLNPCGYYLLTVGGLYLSQGRYIEAAQLLDRSYDQAAREGNVHLMVLAKTYLGNCYANTGRWELMQDAYRVAGKLAKAVSYPNIASHINYNIASTYLEQGRVQQAYELLTASPQEDLLYYHKLALCLERLGRPGKAAAALQCGYADRSSPVSSPDYVKLLDLVKYRLEHPDYLRDPAYSRLMTDTFSHIRRRLPDGFARAHLPYMLEVLEAERRYKDAYQLAREFSDMPRLFPS